MKNNNVYDNFLSEFLHYGFATGLLRSLPKTTMAKNESGQRQFISSQIKKNVKLKYKTPKPIPRPTQDKKPPKPNNVTLTISTSTPNKDLQDNTAIPENFDS